MNDVSLWQTEFVMPAAGVSLVGTERIETLHRLACTNREQRVTVQSDLGPPLDLVGLQTAKRIRLFAAANRLVQLDGSSESGECKGSVARLVFAKEQPFVGHAVEGKALNDKTSEGAVVHVGCDS